MRIGIIGAGELSGSLAGWWTEAGHDVVVGSSQAGTNTATVTDAAAFGDVVLFAPEWATAHDLIDLTAGALTGKPVLDATNPVVWSETDGYQRAVPDDLSGIETLSAWAPDAHWVKAFNTFPTTVLKRRRGRDPLLAEFICTDHRDARGAASRLIQDAGFAPFFAGRASNAGLTETGGPLQMREVDVADATATFALAVGSNW
ncbi:NADPH-dependent F420 reductase [Actinoplanes friuliensis]|jgi:8-hydroxy-5-deazaflavin:NADPH oxidoreductase|uniref:Glycerol-3-phosphate dehydrogenase n=1 Tax=Actinoplanes friuliensis DSM 7358 TaxID=1246995 RepID=U5VZY2_9ACTN|nr:NAD(P)-binding domain-containing protein [Actinoplanes friuliensis]AGZ41280.1 glycerol-3-phosphate dehydrogenase [Actinoplanes friuliensis DSM 7358]